MKDGPYNQKEYELKEPGWLNDTINMMTKGQVNELWKWFHEFLSTDKTVKQVLNEIDNRVVSIVFNLIALDAERQVRDHYPARIRNSREYQEWRACVFERDHYTCQNCGQVGGTINAHHIKSFKDYPDLRLEVNNGITLCLKCHKLAHGKKAIKCL